ncbi:hypothetical protein I5T79_07940 [Stenotrophomonas maltophilia]|nr:hypothetical protein [Stenotrophomonas maltophilia]
MNGLSLLLIRAILALVVLVASVAPGVAQEVVEYIHTDALGSPVAITDVNGQVIERTVYEPYGAVVNRPLTDGPGYTGHVTDSETGLSYMQQRYMDPAVGALLSVDPVTVEGGDMRHLNRYAYAYNNPYKFKDPDGRCPQCLWGGGRQCCEHRCSDGYGGRVGGRKILPSKMGASSCRDSGWRAKWWSKCHCKHRYHYWWNHCCKRGWKCSRRCSFSPGKCTA